MIIFDCLIVLVSKINHTKLFFDPQVNVPLLKSNRTENNGKLLRRPQRRQPEPLQQCLSPVSSPEMEDRHNLLTQRDVGAESHTQDAIVVSHHT